MKIPEINKRIKQIIDFQTNGNVKKFAESIGIPQQTINRLFNIDTRTNKYPLATTEIITSITEMYVNINPSWLLNGKGEMIIKEDSGKLHNPLPKYNDYKEKYFNALDHAFGLHQIIKKKEFVIDELISILKENGVSVKIMEVEKRADQLFGKSHNDLTRNIG